MAISTLMVHWLVRLRDRGLLPRNASLLEIGPQDITAPKSVICRAFPFVQRHKALALFKKGHVRPDCQANFYRLFGVKKYVSVDAFDDRANICHDMNLPLTIARFDIVTNFGTAEHVFDVAQFFANIHDATKLGGMMLHVLPAFGDLNHGFYNFHPIIFRDMAAVNEYEIVDYLYVDNIANRTCDGQDLSKLTISDVTKTERHIVFDLFARNMMAPETTAHDAKNRNTVFDYSFVALRRTSDAPFMTPHQGGGGIQFTRSKAPI